MRRVVIESPYASDDDRNLRYLRAAMRDCALRRESPYASHGLLTQAGVLDDNDPAERALGIELGFAWRSAADATVVYFDLGISDGMKHGIVDAITIGCPIEFRTVPGWAAGDELAPIRARVAELEAENAEWRMSAAGLGDEP